MVRVHNLKYVKDKRKNLRNNPTDAEKYLWYELRESQLNNKKFRRQHSIGKYVVDFYCPEERLVIELDGVQHEEVEQKEYDEKRTEYLDSMGINVIRFKNTDVIFGRNEVVNKIKNYLEKN